jgi:hypothetical protein
VEPGVINVDILLMAEPGPHNRKVKTGTFVNAVTEKLQEKLDD